MNYYKMGLATAVVKPPRPNLYRAGVMVGFRLGNFPGYIKDEIERLNSEVESLNGDLRAQLNASSCAYLRGAGTWNDPLTTGEVTSYARDKVAMERNTEPCRTMAEFYCGPWDKFYQQWQEFRSEHNSGGITGWYERFWGGSLAETIESYRTQLFSLHQSAKQAKFSPVVPMPVYSQPGYADRLVDAPGEAIGGLAGFVKLLVYAAIGIVGFLLLTLLLKGGSLAGAPPKLLVGR